jgi:hypothetical protein
VTGSFQNIKFEIAKSASASKIPAAIATNIQLQDWGRDFDSPSMYSDKSGCWKRCDATRCWITRDISGCCGKSSHSVCIYSGAASLTAASIVRRSGPEINPYSYGF